MMLSHLLPHLAAEFFLWLEEEIHFPQTFVLSQFSKVRANMRITYHKSDVLEYVVFMNL